MEIDSEGNMIKDNVNHPSHYRIGDYECEKVARAIYGDYEYAIFCKINAFKYLWRCNHKHETPTEDISKASSYLNTYLEISLGAKQKAPDSWDKLKEMGLLTRVADDSNEHYSLGTYKGKQI